MEHTELFRQALPVSFPLTDDARASALREGVRQYGFHAALTLTARPACAKLRIAGRHVFRVYINRRIVLNGPARTAHGYARVDELDVTAFLHHGVNHLAVEMLVYGDVYNKYSNDCTLEPDGFLLCELEADGQVLTATGGADWNACRIAARVANASRISHSREASEIYTLEPGWDGWIMGEADGTHGFCRTAPASAPRLLPHTAATITPTVRRFSRVCGYGTCGIDREAQLPRLFFEDNPGYYPAGYYASLSEYPLEDCRRTRERSDAGIRLTGTEDGLTLTGAEDSYILLEGECNTTGFPFARFTCEKPGTVDIVRSEILTPDGDFAYNHNTVTRLHVPAGTWNFTAMEAGVARWLKLYFRGTGTVTLHAAGMLVHEYPDAHRASFLCSDGDVNRLYDAAKRTLLCNTQDIFMDCPDRERGGWLCDSLWTARAAAMLLGDTRVEREFLETFLLTPADGMFRGFFPETYPGSKADYAAMTGITTWSFWLMCELCEYVRRTGDTALRDRFADRVAAFVDGSRSFLGQSGLLERLPWLFIDWSVSNYGEYQTPISVPANALYAYTLAALGRLYTRSDWCAEGERMRGILRAAVLDGRLTENRPDNPGQLGTASGRQAARARALLRNRNRHLPLGRPVCTGRIAGVGCRLPRLYGLFAPLCARPGDRAEPTVHRAVHPAGCTGAARLLRQTVRGAQRPLSATAPGGTGYALGERLHGELLPLSRIYFPCGRASCARRAGTRGAGRTGSDADGGTASVRLALGAGDIGSSGGRGGGSRGGTTGTAFPCPARYRTDTRFASARPAKSGCWSPGGCILR